MRRIPLLIVGVLALALAVPGVASAHGRHHHRHHHAKAHHARLRHFGAASNTSPSTPGMPDAGTVADFTNGVLTITLADGSVVRGKITSDTEIDCVPAVQTPGPTAATSHDGGWGDGQGDQGDQGDDQGGDNGDSGHCHGQSACTVADLVPGATVHEAILRIGGDGAEFKLVLLVKPQQQAS